MDALQEKLLSKIQDLPQEYIEEVLDFIDFLIFKTKKENDILKNIKNSLDDIKKGNVFVVSDKNDLADHFNKLDI